MFLVFWWKNISIVTIVRCSLLEATEGQLGPGSGEQGAPGTNGGTYFWTKGNETEEQATFQKVSFCLSDI